MVLEISFTEGGLRGHVQAPASKSAVHRALICAALADGPTKIRLPSVSADISATISCLRALGARFSWKGDSLFVFPLSGRGGIKNLDCKESGSTLRFLLPLSAALPGEALFTGSGSLPDRPISGLREALSAHGAVFSAERLPFQVSGQLHPGTYVLAGNVSSQYVSGLLFALPLLPGDSTLFLTSPLLSAPYVDMTLEMLALFGVAVQKTGKGYLIPGNQRYRTPGEIAPEGDWSAAAVFLAAGALGGDVTVSGLAPDSKQGDKRILDILSSCGAGISAEGDRLRVFHRTLQAFSADVSQTPDLLPILAVLACGAEGKSLLFNAARLKHKESDRLLSTETLISALGGRARAGPDSLEIEGSPLVGGRVQAFRDHRIVMAAAVAAAYAGGKTQIEGAEAVEKSYPDFFRDFRRLGGKIAEKGGTGLEA